MRDAELLAGLIDRIPGTLGALLSEHGLAIAEHGLGRNKADELAAVSSGFFTAIRNPKVAAIFDGKNSVRQIAIEMDGAWLLAIPAGTAAILAVLAEPGAETTALISEMGRVVGQLRGSSGAE